MIPRIFIAQRLGCLDDLLHQEHAFRSLIQALGQALCGIFLLFFIGLLVGCSSLREPSKLQTYEQLSANAQQQLQPVAPQVYVIGAGDILNIRVLMRSDLKPIFDSSNLRVSELGTIYLPMAGELQVAGLTQQELRKKVATALSSELRQPIINVKIVEARNKRVFLLGEVKSPGVYTLDTNISLLELIATAGGQTKDANMSRIALFRSQLASSANNPSQQGVSLDIKALLEKAQFQQNVILRPGDIVYVPNDSIARSTRYFSHLQSVIQPFVSVISGIGNIIFINNNRR